MNEKFISDLEFHLYEMEGTAIGNYFPGLEIEERVEQLKQQIYACIDLVNQYKALNSPPSPAPEQREG
jgi:hypothetical protein